jgi:8-oxo-dGTP diphosphatase
MPYTYKFPRPSVTTDCIIFSKNPENRKVLLIKRKNEPFRNMWAFPGGFIDIQEDLKEAALRELEEESGLTGVSIEQFLTVGTPGRDPRGRTISIIYIGFVDDQAAEIKAGDDASETSWFEINNLPDLAFDHNLIIIKAIEYICRD